MIGWIRNAVIIFLILSVIYAILSLVARIRNKDRLNADYEDSDKTLSKSEYVAEGLDELTKTTRRKLMLRVYIVPIVIAAILVYLANAS